MESNTGAAVARIKTENEVLDYELRGLDPTHPSVAARGIIRETAERFQVGYFAGDNIMRGRIVIPIHNPKGELIGYAGLSVDRNEPKCKFTPGFDPSLALYNLHRAIEAERLIGNGEILVVQGFLDCWLVQQAGLGSVVSIMGSSLSQQQAEMLCTHFERAVIMFPGSAAGIDSTGRAVYQLSLDMFVRVVDLGPNRQLEHYSEEEIRKLVLRWDYESPEERGFHSSATESVQ